MAGTTYDIGDLIRLHGKVSTSTGSTDYKDPGLITFVLEKPDGSTVTDTMASGTTNSTGGLVRLSTGEFYYDLQTTAKGLYEWRFTSTGTIDTSQEDWLSVRPRRVT